MAVISFNIACRKLKIGQIAQVNQVFQLLHKAHIYGQGFYEVSRMLMRKNVNNTSIKSFSFLCWTLRIVGQKVSTKSLMAGLSDCFPFSYCLLLHKYWNFVPNNNNIPVKETKIWLSFKAWWSLSVPQCTASNKRNWNSWCLYNISKDLPIGSLCRVTADSYLDSYTKTYFSFQFSTSEGWSC